MNAGKPNKKKPNSLFFSFSPARRLHPAFTPPSPFRPFGHPFGVGVPSHPYEHVTQEDWRHLIDDVWKSKEHKVRSKAGKKNRKKLEYNHCSGSRSFVATMTIQPEFNSSENLEFPEFYKKTHTKKNKEWIDPIYAVKHSKMLSLREESF
ncbi:uncharacterized protein LOC113461806 [Phoenix dactylifera]|uniref:Uncharacterized protein LOC113461806 n=1 Tax=Phoenix dactylifera TaxID=42345 RepID=A0A8B8ZKH1_PHODC|nr:uncharacterized protein LOC113461806 [Phoenix dactylifera]